MKKLKLFALTAVALTGVTGVANAETAMLAQDDFVGISFWLVSMACLAATVFFFLERSSVPAGWRVSMTVAGLVTGIAFVHYMYMRDVWISTGDSPTVYRYIDWLITVPLLMLEFYFVLSAVNKQFWNFLETDDWYISNASRWILRRSRIHQHYTWFHYRYGWLGIHSL